MKLGGSRNQGKSLGTELEEAWRCPDRDPWAGERAPRARTGVGNVAGRQQSRARAVVALWWGPACWLLHGKAVGIVAWWGLGYVTPEDGTGLPGLEAITTRGNSTGCRGFGMRNRSHPVPSGGMGKRMRLKPSLWWGSRSYLEAREKTAWQRAGMSAPWQHRASCSRFPRQSSAVPSALGWWQQLERRTSG